MNTINPFNDKRDTSKKRWHRKGYRGHVVNDYRLQREDKEVGLPNKKRFEIRAKSREEIRKVREELGV